MCMALLRKLASVRLPYTEADPAMIDRLRVLEAAGHIRVLIPPVHVDCDHCMRQPPATVLEITPQGRRVLSTGTIEEETPLAAMQRRHASTPRTRAASAALDVVQLAAWFSGTRPRSGD
ncbi:hypothetical protein C4F17_32330 [Variovorax sp. PMC12]|nr:hypothetical protein C4F17_32330 [Variovorax sp. PMC12]